MAAGPARTPRAIRDEDENICKFTDTKAFTEAQCGIMITEDYKEGCLVLQCPLPPVTKKELREDKNVPICNVHNQDEELYVLPVWKGPVAGLTRVPEFKRPVVTAKLTALYSKYDKTVKTSENNLRTLLSTVIDTLARRKAEEKKQAQLSTELRRELADVKERLNSCREEKKKVVGYETTVAARIQRLEEEKGRLDNELKNIRTQSASDIKKLERQAQELETERKRQEDAKRQAEINSNDALRKLEAKTQQLVTELKTARQQVASTEGADTRELAEAKRLAQRLTQELKETKAQLESKRQEAREAVKARQDKAADTAAFLNDYKRDIDTNLDAAKRQAAAATTELKAERKRVLASIEENKEKLLKAEQERNALNREIQRLKEHIAAAATEQKAVEQKGEECKREVDRLKREISELRSRMAAESKPLFPTEVESEEEYYELVDTTKDSIITQTAWKYLPNIRTGEISSRYPLFTTFWLPKLVEIYRHYIPSAEVPPTLLALVRRLYDLPKYLHPNIISYLSTSPPLYEKALSRWRGGR